MLLREVRRGRKAVILEKGERQSWCNKREVRRVSPGVIKGRLGKAEGKS